MILLVLVTVLAPPALIVGAYLLIVAHSKRVAHRRAVLVQLQRPFTHDVVQAN
jgi:hypothetical protein